MMPRLRFPVLLAQLLLLIAVAPAFAQKRGLLPEDSYRAVSVGNTEISPTGEYVAFTVQTVDEKKNTRSASVWLQALRNGRAAGEPFRFTDPTRNSSSPRWSPNGELLSFTSRRGEAEGSVWFLRVGGAGGEAFQIEGVRGTPIWSPDGSMIAFVAEPESEDGGASRRARRIAPDAITTGLDAERFDGHVLTHYRYKRDGTFEWLPHPAHGAKNQIFVVPATGGEARQVTDFAYNVRQAAWSPDGSYFIFAANEREDEEINFDPTGGIYIVPVSGGEPRRIVELPGSQSAPAISPDGRRLAFLHTPAWNAETQLLVVDIDGNGNPRGEPRNLTADWGRTPGAPYWTPDGRSIRWVATVDARTHVYEVPANGGKIRQITQGDRVIGSVSVTRDGRYMAFTSMDPVRPAEVYVSKTNGQNEERLTGFNDEILAEVELQPAERLTWRVSDGTEIEGWVIRPVGHQPGRSYPMILNIHGGPHSVYRTGFNAMFHVLSGAGFYVLYINPRGSTTYGIDFMHAIDEGWGLIDEEDFVTGVEAALAAYPDIDRTRLGVTGGSYGGYMSNWLTARTDLFAASVTRASISQWESLSKTTDSSLPHRQFGGASFERRELYRKLSPISYVENVTAPTLVIHGENDFRTPLGEGEQWYQALKKLSVPTEFVLYPRSSHSIREPWLAADSQARTVQWFAHWLLGDGVTARAESQLETVGAGAP